VKPTPMQYMKKKPLSVKVLIPAYNEEHSIREIIEEIDSILTPLSLQTEIVIVDDGSQDNTSEKALESQIQSSLKLIRLSRNFGKEAAMSAGLTFINGDAVIIMDADGQHPPSLIPALIYHWQQGYEIVSAKRSSRETDSWIRGKLTKIFYALTCKKAKYIDPQGTDFRLLSSRVVSALNQLPEKTRFMKGLFNWVGFKQCSIEYTHGKRRFGHTKYTFLHLFNFAITGLTSFTNYPLRSILLLGVSIFSFSFLGCALLLLNPRETQSFLPLLTIFSFFSGIQLIAMGILGEYIGQIFIETKNRPLYIIDEVVSSTPASNKCFESVKVL